MRRSGYLVAVVITIASAGVARGDEPKDAAKPIARPDPLRFEQAIVAFEKQDAIAPVAQNAILFVGSSSIRKWDLQKWLPGQPVINRGFGGSVLNDSLYYIDRIVSKYRPRMVVLYAGDNDIAAGLAPSRSHPTSALSSTN